MSSHCSTENVIESRRQNGLIAAEYHKIIKTVLAITTESDAGHLKFYTGPRVLPANIYSTFNENKSTLSSQQTLMHNAPNLSEFVSVN